MKDIFVDIESTGLDAQSSQLVAIGVIDGIETKTFFVNKPDEEKKVIEEFLDFLSSSEFCVITYYGSYYDIPFIISRGLTLGIDMNKYSQILPVKQIDVYDVVKNNLKLDKNSMSDVCKLLHIKKEFFIEGKDMPNSYLKAISGDEYEKEKIKAHLKDDVIALREIWLRILPIVEVELWEK